MSYRDMAGGAGGVGPSRGPPPATRAVEAQVFKLTSSVSQLKKLVDQLGTPKDTVDHRHRIGELNQSIQALAKGIKEQLTQLHDEAARAQQGLGPLPPEQQAKGRKLLQDFASVLQDYKATQKVAQEREMASLPRPSAAQQQRGAGGAAHADGQHVEVVIEQQALLQAQQQEQAALTDNAIAYNESLIEERNQGIQEIARQIGEVNEMFQDLAVLINDQGLQIRTIDEQITSTAERAKEGTRELVKAERTQRKMRNKCLWIWLVAAVVVSILIILVFA